MRGPGPGGSQALPLHHPGCEPAVDAPSQLRKRVELGPQIGVIDPVEALFQVSLEPILRGVLQAEKDGSDGLMGGAPRSEPVRMGFELGFPLRFQRQRDQGLPGAIRHGGNAQWTLFRSSGLRDIDATDGRGLAREVPEGRGPRQPFGGTE